MSALKQAFFSFFQALDLVSYADFERRISVIERELADLRKLVSSQKEERRP